MARTSRGRRSSGPRTVAEQVLEPREPSLLAVVDKARSKGVVLRGAVRLALAQVPLVYARLSVLVCAAACVLRGEPANCIERHRTRRTRRARRA